MASACCLITLGCMFYRSALVSLTMPTTGIGTLSALILIAFSVSHIGIRTISFARHPFPPDVIRRAVWLYARFALSFRDVEDLLAERSLVGLDRKNFRYMSKRSDDDGIRKRLRELAMERRRFLDPRSPFYCSSVKVAACPRFEPTGRSAQSVIFVVCEPPQPSFSP